MTISYAGFIHTVGPKQLLGKTDSTAVLMLRTVPGKQLLLCALQESSTLGIPAMTQPHRQTLTHPPSNSTASQTDSDSSSGLHGCHDNPQVLRVM